jgi:predicted Zn-dependent protease
MLLGGQIEEALRIAGLWRAADPSNAQAAATMSKVLVQFDKREHAIAFAKLACDLSPQEGVYQLRLASLCLRYEQPDAARDAATKALALDPSLDGATEILLATEAALAQSSPDRAQTDVMG